MTLRHRARALLAVALGAALATLAALGSVLVGRVADAGAAGVEGPVLAAQLRGAEVSLWLGAAAVLALTWALALAGLQLWLVGPLQALGRELDADPELPSTETTDEIERFATALGHYRRRLDRDTADMAAQLAGARVLRADASNARAQLEEADRMALVGRVALGVAHELGGPLAIVTGNLERLRHLATPATGQGPDDPTTTRCLDQAEAAAGRILTILAELAEPGLPRSRHADRPCDLLAVALRVVHQAELHPRCRALRLTIAGDEPTHPCDASASHLEQIALNLVLNAADATAGRGQVQLRVERQGDWQALHVDDDGPGIDSTEREQVFEPFYTTKAQAGWGLGLAVSRRIAASYGGTLAVTASPAGGARFTLRVPRPATQRGRGDRLPGARSD